MKRILFLALIGVFSSFIIKAQDRVLHGIVHTLDSIPLIGVEIKVQSTKQVFLTDSLGNFTAYCNARDKIKLKANGFYPQTIKVDDNVKLLAINMKLKPGEKQRSYAVGYGYVSDENNTGAVTSRDSKQNDYSRYESVIDIIRDMGGQIRNGSIVLRGTKSFQGSSAALIVVDGVVADYQYLNDLRPVDIKRVNILRDAASSSVYGSRGANGVVLIETIKGN